MFELLDTQPDVQVREAEYKRLLGFPERHPLEGRALELAQWARDWYSRHGRPWLYARETGRLELGNGALQIHGREFASKRLHEQLAQAEAAGGVLAVVSAGPECEAMAHQLWQEEKPDEYFFLEIYGSAVVEHLITYAGGRICGWAEPAGMAVLPHYSPGYTGWDVADQVKLFELLRDGQAFPGELQVHTTGMLRPKKSLLALFGLTRRLDLMRSIHDLVPCENCSLPDCGYRRAPYRQALSRLEDVRQLQTPAPAAAARGLSRSGLDRDAHYSLNLRALRKWSQERLKLTFREDRSLEALFRFEGTTCSNLGHPLEFHYVLQLGPPEQGYRINDAACVPAPGDTGHEKMCAWLEDAQALARSIESEQPLLGRPLNEILTFQRRFSPSGCYCNADSRTHKWGLVLEVIHYALVQREKESE
jgi:hypothetical protein